MKIWEQMAIFARICCEINRLIWVATLTCRYMSSPIPGAVHVAAVLNIGAEANGQVKEDTEGLYSGRHQ